MKNKPLFIAIILLLTVVVLFGCNRSEGEITSLKKVGDVLLRVGERARIERFLEKEGDER